MAYTRGNLAVQPKRKEQANPLYREKTKVVTRRTGLPIQEKLLYLLTLTVFVLVASGLIWRYLHIYDLNKQGQQLDEAIAKTNKQIATYQMEKQKLEQMVADRAKAAGYVAPDEERSINVSVNSTSTDSNDN